MWQRRSRTNGENERRIGDPDKVSARTMNRALKLLAAKPRSAAELRRRLLEKSWTSEAIVNSVIERLREYRYLDDAQYARDVAISKLRQKPQGRRRLKLAMSRKELPNETITSALDSAYETIPEEELILTAIEKRVRLRGIPRSFAEKKKMFDHLVRLGFDYGLIREKLGELKKDRSHFE